MTYAVLGTPLLSAGSLAIAPLAIRAPARYAMCRAVPKEQWHPSWQALEPMPRPRGKVSDAVILSDANHQVLGLPSNFSTLQAILPPGGLRKGRFGRKPWGEDDDFSDMEEVGETCEASTMPDADRMLGNEEGEEVRTLSVMVEHAANNHKRQIVHFCCLVRHACLLRINAVSDDQVTIYFMSLPP